MLWLCLTKISEFYHWSKKNLQPLKTNKLIVEMLASLRDFFFSTILIHFLNQRGIEVVSKLQTKFSFLSLSSKLIKTIKSKQDKLDHATEIYCGFYFCIKWQDGIAIINLLGNRLYSWKYQNEKHDFE